MYIIIKNGITIFCVLLFPLLYCKAVRRQVIMTNDYQDVFQDAILQIQYLKRSTEINKINRFDDLSAIVDEMPYTARRKKIYSFMRIPRDL